MGRRARRHQLPFQRKRAIGSDLGRFFGLAGRGAGAVLGGPQPQSLGGWPLPPGARPGSRGFRIRGEIHERKEWKSEMR